MTDERKRTESVLGDRFIAKMIDELLTRCAERMMPRMQAMCGAPAGEQEADGRSEPPCPGCG